MVKNMPFTEKDFDIKVMAPYFKSEFFLAAFLAGKGYVRTDIDDELNGYYLFKDNKADTLAVAHMDTVFPSNVNV